MSQTKRDLSHLCQGCKIRERVGFCAAIRSYLPPKPSDVRYILIGEAPGKSEVENNVPFIGPSGEVLRECAERAGLNLRRDSIITNSVQCPPRLSAGEMIVNPDHEHALHCLPNALKYIAAAPHCEAVIAVGGVVYKALTGNKKASVVRDHGQWFKMTVDNATRYNTFRLWLNLPFVQLRIQEIEQSSGLQRATEYYGAMWNPEHQWESCEDQIENAKEYLRYSERWMEVDCIPTLHPAYCLRQGRYGQAYENLKLDLEKVRMRVRAETIVIQDKDYAWLETADEFTEFVDETIADYEAGRVKVIAGDVETDFAKNNKIGLSSYDPSINLVSIQFSVRDGHGRALLLQHPRSRNSNAVDMAQIRADLKRLLQTVPSVWHNATFDYNTIRCRLGIQNWKIAGDTMLMEHWLNAGKGRAYGLDDMGAVRVGTGRHKSAAKDWLAQNPGKEFKDMPMDIALDYGCGDVDVTLQLYWQIRKEMEREIPTPDSPKTMWEHFQHHLFGVNQGWQVIADLEWHGMRVDKEVLDWLNEEYPKRMDTEQQRLMGLPFMVDNWLRVDYRKKVAELKQLNIDIQMEHSQGNKRRRPRKIPSFEEFAKDSRNWFNPNSNPQTDRLWCKVLNLKFGLSPTGQPFFTDIEFSDDKCPRCGRDRCKCPKDKRHIPTKPKATDHNRKIILDTVKQLRNGMAARPPEKQDPANLAKADTIIEVISAQSHYKKLSKLFGTYVKGIYPLIPDKPGPDDPWEAKERCHPLYKPFCDWPEPWSIHPQYKMNGTDTGRLSSADPNGQNFPGKGDDRDTNVKLPYISHWAGHGGVLLQPDYSQIEVRVMVVKCGDEKLTEALNAGKDIHRFVASIVHGILEEQVTADLRKPCKTVTFGILYGQTVASLAQALHISVQEAQGHVDKFFAMFPKVKQLVDEQHRQVQEHRKVFTRFGRVRWLHHVDSANVGEANKALRDCVNTPIQSEASDLCWQSMGRVWQEIKRLKWPCRPFGIIHDSQTFDVGPGYVFDLIELQYYQMVYRTQEMYPWMVVKPEADFSVGVNWGRLIDCNLVRDGEQISHNHLILSGQKPDVEAVCEQFDIGGLKVAVADGIDGPHPQKEEAEKGVWYRKIHVERPVKRALLHGRNLEIVSTC